MTTVEIHNEDFHASIVLDKLAELPMPHIRKIFKLMKSAPYENELSIYQTSSWLSEMIADRKAFWERASSEYRTGWSLRTDRVTHANNRKLIEKVRKAKLEYDRWTKIQAIFNET